MSVRNSTSAFYATLPVQRGFRALMDPARYAPLPDDWSIGIADVVQSTKAIAEKRYKAVNMAGAAVIASVTNALGGHDFPFVFGGDGASFAVPPRDADKAREALAATAAWADGELGLTLRVALIPVAHIRAQGFDVRVARYGRVCLEVCDRGAGVAAADVERIFEPFYTRGAGGTGLGLFLARELAEINGKKTSGIIKDTVVVPYYGRAAVDFTADQPGLTLFHCHIQQHMDFGFKALFRYA